ncbi:MAG: mechanosensitive ion channel family protein [Deltaproteobacteria bacterium]
MPRLLPALLLLLAAASAGAAPPVNPLEPLDRSSPRATLRTFLSSTDQLAREVSDRYATGQSREAYGRIVGLAQEVVRCLDLAKVPPASRLKEGRAAALALFETLSRIPLPPLDEVPDAEQMALRKDGAARRWTLPGTEITLVRVDDGSPGVEFLFSPETVARAEEFYERTRSVPRLRGVPVPDMHALVAVGGGWMIPYRSIVGLPAWLRAPLWGQAAWKWFALVLLALACVPLVRLSLRLSRMGEERGPFVRALAHFSVPLLLLVLTPTVAWLALVQVNLVGGAGSSVQVLENAILTLTAAWMAWRAAPVIAEAIIASPRIPREGMDAHLIRLAARLLGILGSLALLSVGADRLGIPVYGIVAGLGVGGLAVALAAQPTLENLIAGLNLYADRPLRVGERCKIGDTVGDVEAIGIRSTRFRTIDRTLTTIPNGALAKMTIANQSRRDRMLFQAKIGLRYETTEGQLRAILTELKALLSGHPRVLPEKLRVRFVGLGTSSLDVQLRAFVDTVSQSEFLAVQEELLLGVMRVVEKGGSAFAFPSQTLYLGRDELPGKPGA